MSTLTAENTDQIFEYCEFYIRHNTTQHNATQHKTKQYNENTKAI